MRLSEDQFNEVFNLVPRLCVDACIRHEGEIFLAQRAIPPCMGMWHFPGGGVYVEETLEKALVRNVQAETGLLVRSRRLLGYVEYPPPIAIRKTVALVFDCDIVGGLAYAGEGTAAVGFFDHVPTPTIDLVAQFIHEHELFEGIHV